jgi:hypothetical protein
MASCTSMAMYGESVEDFIKAHLEYLKDDTLSEVQSTDIERELDNLYALRKAVKENDIEFIEAHGFMRLKSTADKELVQEAFIKSLGETFSFTYGASKKARKGILLSAKEVNGSIYLDFVENGTPKSYSFSTTSDGRSHTSKSRNSYITIPGFRNFLDNYTADQQSKKEHELVFGSKDTNIKLGDSYKNKDYVHGSIDHMKALLQKLHLLGGNKANQEDLDGYIALFDKMTPDFFNKMELYVNTNAKNSEGAVRARRIDIAVSRAPSSIGNQQSEASIYMEEVIHSMTAAAMHADVPASRALRRELKAYIDLARDQLDYKAFLPDAKDSIDPKKEEEYAKFLYRYIFVSKNSDYEFIAKALTVPEVQNALKNVKIKEGKDTRRFLERVNDFFAKILDILKNGFSLDNKNENVHEAVTNLAFRFAELNKKANRDLEEKGNYLTTVFDFLNNVDDTAAQTMSSLGQKVFGEAKDKKMGAIPDSLYGKVKYYAEVFAYSIVNPTYTKAMGVVASSYGLGPNSTIREIIGGMFATDSAQKTAEFLTMQSGYIDKLRNNQIDMVRKNVLSKFKNPKEVTKEEEEALSAILLDIDFAGLFGKNSIANKQEIRKTTYNNKTIRRLLTDEEYLERTIKDVKRSLKNLDATHYTWHRDQAVGLGIYMATHSGSPEQNLNAFNIARGIHSTHRKKPDDNVVAAIDELAALVGLQNTDKDVPSNKNRKTVVADLIKKDWKGVQHVADVVEGFKRNSDETVFKGRKTNKIKGYSREVFDDTIIMEIAPAEDRKKMEAQGFTFRKNLAPRAGDIRNKPMALYITDTLARPDRLRGGVRLNQITSKGTTITETSYKDGEGFNSSTIRERSKRDIIKIQRDALKRAEAMEKGTYDFKDRIPGVVAVINEDGKVVDYRYMMDKETKKELLGQDTRISEVMGRSFGTLVDKDQSQQHNLKALDSIKLDMKENWTSGTKGNDGMTEYTLIGPKATDPEMLKLYYMLPREFQEAIQKREDETLAVRTDLLYLYFGYSNLSITDFPGLEKVSPKILIKVLKVAEMLWMEAVKIIKTNILIKMPAILLSNIFSNFLYAIMRGYDPFTVANMYVQSYRDISNYNKDVRNYQEFTNRKQEIVVALERDTLSAKRKNELKQELLRVNGKLKSTKESIESSPIHELVVLGLDQNVEDVNNDTERDTNRITGFFDEQLQKAPELVRDGVDILFITKRTKFYKVANEFLETSDLVGRDIQNRLEKKNEEKWVDGKRDLPNWWLENKPEGYKRRQRLTGDERKTFLEEAKVQRQYDLVEDFINYTKPSSRFEEYLNKVGILMFTKYVKRIQRIILKTGSRAPIKALVGSLGFAYLGGLPSIHEQSFLVKDWYGDSLGPGNVFPVYGPIEHFMNFVTPALLKTSTYDFLIF